MNLQDRQFQNAIADQTNFSAYTSKTGIIITYAITANARNVWGRGAEMPKRCLDCGHDTHSFVNGTYICDACGKGKPKPRPAWAKSGRRLPPGTTKLEKRRALAASRAGEPLSYPCKVKKCHQCNGKYRIMKPAGSFQPCMCTCHDAKNDRWVAPVNNAPGMRTCTRCKQSKSLSAYSKTGKRLKAWCRPCCVEINKAYRKRKKQEGGAKA